jgi:hypothetical protein
MIAHRRLRAGNCAWDQDPWVTAISFTAQQRNIDA